MLLQSFSTSKCSYKTLTNKYSVCVEFSIKWGKVARLEIKIQNGNNPEKWQTQFYTSYFLYPQSHIYVNSKYTACFWISKTFLFCLFFFFFFVSFKVMQDAYSRIFCWWIPRKLKCYLLVFINRLWNLGRCVAYANCTHINRI